jgi:hypothetical protein
MGRVGFLQKARGQSSDTRGVEFRPMLRQIDDEPGHALLFVGCFQS